MSSPAPDESKLRALLEGSLSADEEARMLELVEAHPEWQQALDRLAAGGQTWQSAAQHLREPAMTADAALRSAIASVVPPTIAAESAAAEPTAARLDFLEPADDARYLGRFGQYLVEEVVGRGAFGIVLKAFDPQLRRIVALKVLAPHLASNATACRRFDGEAHAAAAVVHDHVITIHSVGDQPLPHLVMQYVAGQSLQEKLDQCGPLGIAEVLRIGMQTAAGLAAAHKQGKIHRDIKPANILLENGVERVKITDFGLARAADDASMTQSGVVAGTPQYMSPEQARGETVDARSDLFSLGSVLYAMCAGRPPFRATTTMGVLKRVCEEPTRPVREINPEIPDWLEAIIDKLMAKRPEDRFTSAQEVSDLLGTCLSHVQQPAANLLPAFVAGTLRVPSVTAAIPLHKEGNGTRSVSATDADDAILEHARRSVREPAIGLVITGILNWIALAIIFISLSSVLRDMNRDDTYRWLIPVIAALGIGSGLIVVGGLKMMRLENRLLVISAAIAAMLIGPGYFVGLPIGLWALVALQRRDVKAGFAQVHRRHWPGVASAATELPEEGEWSCRCLTCGYVAPAHKWGIVRIGAASRGKSSVLWCPSCRWFRWMAIERFTAKAHLPHDELESLKPIPQSGSSAAAMVLLVLLILISIPLTLAAVGVAAYFFHASSSIPTAHVQPGRFFPPMGKLVVECPDSRFDVRIRYDGPSGEESVTGLVLTPRSGETMDIPAGEYTSTILWDGLEVRQDRFTVPEDGAPVTYTVPRGGTLRFIAGEGNKNLGLSLNHITGNKFWDWPDRQWFVVPEGLVHVDLRRPSGDGAWHILTTNYFDIVADQETVLRVREKDVELVSAAEENAAIALRRENLKSVEQRYAAGQESIQTVLEARLKLHQSRADWAEKAGRYAEAVTIRRELVSLAEERVKALETALAAGAAPPMIVTEAKIALLGEQERLQAAEARLQEHQSQPAPAAGSKE